MSFWRRPFGRGGGGGADDGSVVGDDQSVVTDGTLNYVVEKAGNNSGPTYQEASGAPVEVKSPLGYGVGSITIIAINVSMMVGTGIYSTPSTILSDTASTGLALIFWVIGFIMSAASFAVYLEFAAYFSNRSGGEVVYLEQAFPRPKWLFPIAFAFQTVILSFSSGNAIVMAEYLFACAGSSYTDWQLKGVAIAGYTVAFLFVALNTRVSYALSNAIAVIKVLTLVFISITGLVVLGGHTKVADPTYNFRDSFNQGNPTAYGLTNALYKIAFSYSGYTNAFNVVNEVKNPIKQIRRNGTISLVIVTILYILANIAYFAAVPREQLIAAEQIAASLFFTNVFGSSRGVRGLDFLIALSSFGNLVAVLIGQSRVLRECGRQGVLPFPRFWISTKPLGTPLGPYFVKWALTIIMILAPPAGDAFEFITDLQVYPSAFFSLLLAVGLYIVRWRRSRLSLPRPVFRSWDAAVIFTILIAIYQLVMPWYPPTGGPYAGDVSFWYATYIVTGIGIIIGCGVYYWAWIWAIPRIGKYRIRQQMLTLEDGATSHTLVKVPLAELPEWDRTHDALGRERTHGAAVTTGLETDNGGAVKGTSSWNQTESLEEKSSV